MNCIWIVLIVLSILFGVFSGNGARLSEAMLSAGGDTVAIVNAGGKIFKTGFMGKGQAVIRQNNGPRHGKSPRLLVNDEA